MCSEQDGAISLQGREQIPHAAASFRVHSGGWFVQHHHLRLLGQVGQHHHWNLFTHLAVAYESNAQVDLPLHAPGQGGHVHVLLGLEVEHPDVLGALLLCVRVAHPLQQVQCFGHGAYDLGQSSKSFTFSMPKKMRCSLTVRSSNSILCWGQRPRLWRTYIV